jgi:hypothetical protein
MHPDFKDNGVVPRPQTWAEKEAERAKNEVMHSNNNPCDTNILMLLPRQAVYSKWKASKETELAYNKTASRYTKKSIAKKRAVGLAHTKESISRDKVRVRPLSDGFAYAYVHN